MICDNSPANSYNVPTRYFSLSGNLKDIQHFDEIKNSEIKYGDIIYFENNTFFVGKDGNLVYTYNEIPFEITQHVDDVLTKYKDFWFDTIFISANDVFIKNNFNIGSYILRDNLTYILKDENTLEIHDKRISGTFVKDIHTSKDIIEFFKYTKLKRTNIILDIENCSRDIVDKIDEQRYFKLNNGWGYSHLISLRSKNKNSISIVLNGPIKYKNINMRKVKRKLAKDIFYKNITSIKFKKLKMD